jgi:hypothetical protein
MVSNAAGIGWSSLSFRQLVRKKAAKAIAIKLNNL